MVITARKDEEDLESIIKGSILTLDETEGKFIVIGVESFSNMTGPGINAGFLIRNYDIVEELEACKLDIDTMGSMELRSARMLLKETVSLLLTAVIELKNK